ncbi:7-cyano-7-deazaguanine synthase QueC [Candidatus Palauibacter sp.]|uniref:7-cyano-7-deazaguanine synthase QueC n=1 Tax=Candidatus Palauibacter sp. TaxID=3101350 RepID=UPI003B015790
MKRWMMGRKAVVLLSGGLDSATTLAIASEQGYRPYALTFRYGQRHEIEVDAACRVAKAVGVIEHLVTEIDLRTFGGSALTGDLEVPKDSGASGASEGIPVTYVPARNTIFLSFALAWAEVLGSSDIFIGVNAVDYSGYPDCRPEFIDAFEKLARFGTRAGVEEGRPFRIHAPLIDLTKAEIIRRGLELGIDYRITRSCYDPDASGAACGECESCRLRLAGFAAAGAEDPAPYQVT